MLRFHRAHIIWHCFSLRVRSRTLCAQWTCHISELAYLVLPYRATSLCTRTFPFPFHVFSYLYQCGPSTRLWPLVCFTVSSFVLSTRLLTFLDYARLLALCRLVYAYHYHLCLSYYSLSTRLLSRYFWTLTRYWVISLSCIFVLVPCILLYIRVGDVGLFPIFNLLCNHPKGVTCEIPRTLLVLSSSLVKATALRFLGVISSVYSLTGSEVQPTQCTSVRS